MLSRCKSGSGFEPRLPLHGTPDSDLPSALGVKALLGAEARLDWSWVGYHASSSQKDVGRLPCTLPRHRVLSDTSCSLVVR